jgi:hypothetical protein
MIEVMKDNSRLAGEIYQRQDEKYERYNKQDRNALLERHSQHGTRERNDDQRGRDDGADGGVKYRPVEQRGPTRRPRCSLTAKLRCAILTMQDLTATRAGRLMSV